MKLTPADRSENPGFEVRVHENGEIVATEVFDTLEEAEAFVEQWNEQVPGAHIEIEDRTHDHAAWQLIEDDTAMGEDYPRAVGS